MRHIVKTIQSTTLALGGVYKILTTSILIGIACKYAWDGIKSALHKDQNNGDHK